MSRILLETTALDTAAGARGTGRYIRALIEANRRLGNDLVQTQGRARSGRLAEIISLPERTLRIRRQSKSIYHAPTPSFAVPARLVPRQVVSILDTIPLEVPEYGNTGMKSRLFFRIAAQAPAILTISEHAASRISTLVGIEPDRIIVAPLPVSSRFTVDGPGNEALPQPFVATICDLRYRDQHKRSEWLPLLAAELAQSGISLVAAGHGTESWNKRTPGLIGLGYVSDNDWATTLRAASAFLNVSAFEGQGMPPLEAIACGTPVVSPANSAIPEMVGNAGILVDEISTTRTDVAVRSELVEALVSLCRDDVLAAALRQQCLTRAAELPTAADFAAQIHSAYDRV